MSEPSSVVQPVRTGFAAGLLGAMLLVSGSLAIWSARQLLRGDDSGAAYAALPASCRWVLVADDPAGLPLALGLVAELPQAGAEVRAMAARQASLWRAAAAVPGLDDAQPWALCGQGDGSAVLAARRKDGGVERYAVGSRDGPALLAGSAAEAARANLNEYVPFRSALERVGGGQAHVYLDSKTLQETVAGLALPDLARDGSAHALWLGAVLRVEKGQIHLRTHVGTGPAGASWLKAHLDPVGVLDATPLIDPAAVAAGVLHFHPGAWMARHPTLRGLDTRARDTLGAGLASLAPQLTGHLIWQVLPAAADGALAWMALLQLSPAAQGSLGEPAGERAGLSWRRAGSFLALAPSRTLADRAAALVQHPTTAPEQQVERARILSENQGFFLRDPATAPRGTALPWTLRGPLACEWLWLDTGFVAELSLPAGAPTH